MDAITKNSDGTISWIHHTQDVYLATGIMTNGKRFKTQSNNWHWIKGINLWRGNKWLLRGGKRYKLVAVTN